MIQYLKKIKIILDINFFKNDVKFLKKCNVLFFCHDNDRGLSIDGQAFSPLLDSVFIEMSNKGFNCQSISLPWSTLGIKETYVNSLNINNKYLFHKLINKIKSFFGCQENNYYLDLLVKVKPKAIFGIGLPQKLCEACKELNIIDVELLHGIGYTYLPWGWSKLNSLTLPSVVLSLDKTSTNTFQALAVKGVRVLEVPHPFLRIDSNGGFTNIQSWNYQVDISFKKHILVTLQWGYSGEDKDFSGIVSNGIFYEEIEELIRKRTDFCWHFRLHPVQMQGNQSKKALSFVKRLNQTYKNTLWERASSVPLLKVADACDVHLTLSSMSAYDVAMVGKPSLIFCPRMRNHEEYKNYFNDLEEEGYAKKVDFDLNFIEKWIESAFKLKPRAISLGGDDAWDYFLSSLKMQI
jgi:hypothetical protein